MRSRVMAMVAMAGLTTAAVGRDFTAGNLVVSTVGDGSAALSSAATAVSLNEFSPTGTFIRSLALPTAASGLNHRFSNSGSATSECQLSRSTDGRYLVLGGYDAAIGTASVVSTTSAVSPRVVARIDMFDSIDTSTALTDAYSGNNVRSVCSTNGSDLWLGGTASTGGIRYATLGATTSTALNTTTTNMRVVNIFNGQLYTSSATGAFQGISTVGSGTPTAGPAAITLLPGFPTASGPSSYDYFFADANTVYVADDRSAASGGGIQKWVQSAGTWGLSYTIPLGATTAGGARGLTGVVDGLGVTTLYATTTEAAANRLVQVVDTGAASVFTTLATANANTAFRGVDFAPVPAPGSLALLALSGAVGLRRRRR